MTLQGWILIAGFVAILLALTKPVGVWLFALYEGRRTPLHIVLGPVERGFYKLSGIDPAEQQGWRRYAVQTLLFNVVLTGRNQRSDPVGRRGLLRGGIGERVRHYRGIRPGDSMTRRDIGWRSAGMTVIAISCGFCAAFEDSPLIIPFFVLALIGLPLVIHGKRVGQVFRAERGGRTHTADAVHWARLRQRAGVDRNVH